MLTRRDFLKITGGSTIVWYAATRAGMGPASRGRDTRRHARFRVDRQVRHAAADPAGDAAGRTSSRTRRQADRLLRDLDEAVLATDPSGGMPPTTVWGYGPSLREQTRAPRPQRSVAHDRGQMEPPGPRASGSTSSSTQDGAFLPHLLPVDPTLHWANPPGGDRRARDMRPTFDATPGPYTGPVPIVTHVHGAAGVGDESDGYAEAWYLPDANDIPTATRPRAPGTTSSRARPSKFGVDLGAGFATFQYPNDQRASTIWYHDHALGMTRLNVYAGPGRFFLVRGGPGGRGRARQPRSGRRPCFPGPAPERRGHVPVQQDLLRDPDRDPGPVVQRRRLAVLPGHARLLRRHRAGRTSPRRDISPIWNPEFFGDTIMVNGNTWPFQTVEQRRYRFRFLNGCHSRFLILDFDDIPGVEVWQIGNEGGFLAAPVNLTDANGNRLLMGPAERADLIVDFTNVPVGEHVLGTSAPTSRSAAGAGRRLRAGGPGDHRPGDAFRVVPARRTDPTTPPQFLQLPPIARSPAARSAARPARERCRRTSRTRRPRRGWARWRRSEPASARWTTMRWEDAVTENPARARPRSGSSTTRPPTPIPMHIHEVALPGGEPAGRSSSTRSETTVRVGRRRARHRRRPSRGRRGWKDTVDRLPRPGHSRADAVRARRSVRLALPHRRARGQRDDAALPDRAGPARPTHLVPIRIVVRPAVIAGPR